jgi:hypothetical protein
MRALTSTQVAMIRGDIRASGVELRDLEDDLLDHICTTLEIESDSQTSFDLLYEEVKARVCPNGYKELHDETIVLITQKYNSMKKFMNTTGIIGSASLLGGSLFKLMQFPGAGIMLGVGTLIILLGYLPLMLILALQQTDTSIGKLRNISGYIGANLIVAGIFLQVMHWADNRVLMAGLAIFILLFVPLYLKAAGKDAIMKIQPATLSVLLIAIVSSLFAFSIKRPSHTFYDSLAIITNDTQSSYELKYARLLKMRSGSSELSSSSDASLAYIEGLKEQLVLATGFDNPEDVFHYKRATSFSSQYDEIFNSTTSEYNGRQLHAHLNSFLSTLKNESNGIVSYIDPGNDASEWVNQHFNRRPFYSSYSQLIQLQLEIVLLELEVLSKN